jgi:hypothetical protein
MESGGISAPGRRDGRRAGCWTGSRSLLASFRSTRSFAFASRQPEQARAGSFVTGNATGVPTGGTTAPPTPPPRPSRRAYLPAYLLKRLRSPQ